MDDHELAQRLNGQFRAEAKIEAAQPKLQWRLTEPFKTGLKEVYQDFRCPQGPYDFENHLVGVLNEAECWQWNFIFSKSGQSNLKNERTKNPSIMTETRIQPEGSRIAEIRCQVFKDCRLIAIQMYDAAGKCILEAGESENLHWKWDEKTCEVKRFKVDPDERVVGIKSGLRQGRAEHKHLQFVIAKFH